MASPRANFACETCQQLWEKQDAFLKRWRDKMEKNKELKELGVSPLLWFDVDDGAQSINNQQRMVDHIEQCKITNPPKKTHKGNGTYKGPWAFTITCSPKDNLRFGDMIKAVNKVMKQKTCPAIKYAWYLEHKGISDEGEMIHPHIHGMYETATGGRIEAKHWKRAWSIWDEDDPLGSSGGFRGGYHRPITHEDGYAKYIAEDGGACGTFNLEEPVCLLTDEPPTDQ